jgi:hypothetical protein
MAIDPKSTASEAIKAATDELVEALKAGKSEVLTAYLAAIGRFHTYSFCNVMLIFTQCPTATHVAGYQTWKSLGRNVKKGEHGIRILAPLFGRRPSAGEDTVPIVQSDVKIESKPTKVLHGFRFVAVFDQAQTEGKDLAGFARVEGDVSGYYERLVQYVSDLGIALESDPNITADGLSYGGKIVLKADLAPAEQFSVLVHELGHELLHKKERRAETTKTVRETEAEAVAFAVCSALGLQTNGAAADYISLYDGDADLLIASLTFIQQAAIEILKAILADVDNSIVATPVEELALAA